LSDYLLTITFVLIIVWFFGTRWGQKQASRGTCSLMRHFRPEKPSFPSETIIEPEPIVDEKKADAVDLDIESLVDIIRYSNDPEQRGKALSELEKLGMVDQL
jgi:hypothetical protein